jgi:hypothetical protein
LNVPAGTVSFEDGTIRLGGRSCTSSADAGA